MTHVSPLSVLAVVGVGVGLAVLGFVASFAFLVWFAWATDASERLDADIDALLPDHPRDH